MQSKFKIFASLLLVLSLTFTMFLSFAPESYASKKPSKVGVCHVTGSEKNRYVYIVVSAKAVDGEGANDHTQHEHDGFRDLWTGDSVGSVINGPEDCPGGAIQIKESHNIVLEPVCHDEEKGEYRWEIYHQDDSDIFYPVSLALDKDGNSILTEDFFYSYKSGNPYEFSTSDEDDKKVSIYWFNAEDDKWIKADEEKPSKVLCEEPMEPETHNLVLTSMCYDDEEMVRVWRVFHKDSSDTYFPIQLGYKIYPEIINSLDVLFGFDHTEAMRFDNPYLFETVYDGNPQTVILYWWDSSKEQWIMDDTKAANTVLCEKEYVQCSETTYQDGEWSAWTVDLEDDSQEVREKTRTFYDSEDSEIVCGTETIYEYRDRELCEWDTATYADDPLCVEPSGDGDPEEEEDGDVLGEDTVKDEEEVKGTTTVVLASTAAGDRSTLYLVQSLLLLVTGVSLIYVGREYIIRE